MNITEEMASKRAAENHRPRQVVIGLRKAQAAISRAAADEGAVIQRATMAEAAEWLGKAADRKESELS